MVANLLVSMLLISGPSPGQWETSCPAATPELERVTRAAETGDVGALTAYLDSGADVEAMWRDSRSPRLCQSLLIRSLFSGQDRVFQLLLQRGADPLKLPKDSLMIPVGAGNIEMALTLVERGLKPDNAFELVNEALKNKRNATRLPMLQFLTEAGVPLDASTVPAYFLTDDFDLVRFIVPKYIEPNDVVGLGESQCDVQKLFGLYRTHQDGCQGTVGPLWLHFVITGRQQTLTYMIEHGADLSRRAEVWDNGLWPFTAMDVAERRHDKRMIDLLRRAGATERIYPDRRR